uniref:Uncharacterized protein n=1 Tax=Oryza meridionalis TaxID=40149 RepID=A0A0E0E1J5_9ORYZ
MPWYKLMKQEEEAKAETMAGKIMEAVQQMSRTGVG